MSVERWQSLILRVKVLNNMAPMLKKASDRGTEIVGVRVTFAEKERIAKFAKAAGRTITEFVRAALEAHIERQSRAKKGKRS